MRYYYFFEPHPLRRLNAWNKTANIDMHSSGGHRVEFAGQKIFPVSFILRHYIVLSKTHAIAKYASRIHSQSDLQKGWMSDRAFFSPQILNFLAKARLKKLNDRGNMWDKSDPWIYHEFLRKDLIVNHQPNPLQLMTERKQPSPNSRASIVKSDPQVAFMPNKQKNYNLCICAIFKNEAPYLAEWIEFHKAVGVENFYLYNNNSTDNYLDILRPYIKGDEIILINWPQHPAQLEAYEHCLKTYGSESKWIAFIDIDEYLFSPIKSDLKEVLAEFHNYPGVVVNWVIFGNSGHDQKQNGLTIENFTQRAKDDYERHRRVKSIVQPELAKFPVSSFHKFSYFNQSYPYGVTENKEPAPPDNEALHSTYKPSFQKLRLNHYITRSNQEQFQKWVRGMPDKEGFREWEILEDCASRNDVQDLTLQKYVPLVKKSLKNHAHQDNWPMSQPAQNLLKPQYIESYAPMPIVVGFPRSGTTLLRLMLDAHPDLAIPPETHFIPDILNLESDIQNLRYSFYQKLTENSRWQDFHLKPDEFYENLAKIEPFTISSGLRCFYKMYAKRFNKFRWGDKTPLYVVRIKDIQTALPEAHFIHIIRDGRDTALSMKKMWWGAGDDIEKQASNWIWQIREGRQQAQFCQHYLEVRYEELITNTTKVLKEICKFINLPYSSQMEDYYKSAESRLNEFNAIYKPDGTCLRTKEQHLSIHNLTFKQPDQSRIGRWKREMSNEDRAKYEKIAGPMLRDLGYDTKNQLEENKFISNLQQIQADLHRSHSRLSQIKAFLE
ncbi:sulfotransferase [Laspinema sp. D1]|uniref:Sulfotransferase n=1 Tax=Laspinema palackyanum D2a TaxID=2953684 RepID=A0ABT2MN80_9CYAN|nr:sulfotransferase [Laspinema sp. D2a]